NYTGFCPKSEVLRNNEFFCLWNSFEAHIFPLTFRNLLETVKNIFYFSQFRLNESIGISSMAPQDYALPQNLFSTIGGNALGATGVIIWRAKISTIYRATEEKCKNSLILNLNPTLSMSQQQLRCEE
ncbi:hypothetical protein EK904_001424, partial [Melospiza melodia maxima]